MKTFVAFLCLLSLGRPVSALTEAAFREWIDRATIAVPSAAKTTAQSSIGDLDTGLLPFCFEYGGLSSDDLLPSWTREARTVRTPSGERRIVTWDDPKTGLRVKWAVLLHRGFPAVEMRLAFENRGMATAPVLRQVRVLRQRMGGPPKDLIYMYGSDAPGAFVPMVCHLGSYLTQTRLSACTGWDTLMYFPFWLVLAPDGEGLYYALGWTGQWAADFSVKSVNGPVAVEAGMEHLNLRLEPGECISQPSVLVGHFSGGRWAGHNALRRKLYDRYVPLLDGEKVLPPVSWDHYFGLSTPLNEESMLAVADAVAPLGIEYFVIDAGWYNVEFWHTGDWRVNRAKFPRGLEPVASAVRSHGMAMGLWFEPERVTDAAYEAFEHKEWLVFAGTQSPAIKVWLLDLSRPDVRRWMVEMIGDYVRSLRLEWIRLDMNYPQLKMWLTANSDPQRLGIVEIRYIEGLYEVMDTLLKNHPKLLIEAGFGGGRRMDLEILRRCHSYWMTDVTGDGDITRPHLTGANLFLPANYLNSNLVRLDSPYDYYCQFGGALGFGHDFRDFTRERAATAAEIIRRYKEIRRYLVEDYYPLFDCGQDRLAWDGWQFHDPKDNSGFFVVFRLPNSPYAEAIVKLYGLDPARQYAITADRTGILPEVATGQQLTEGFPVRMEKPRSAILVRYEPLPPA